MTDYKRIDDIVETTYLKPSKRKATLGAAALVAGVFAIAPGCANLDQRTAAFDRSKPVYGLSSWDGEKREPVWTKEEAGFLAPVYSWFGESNRPSLTGGKATFFRPTNYLMWIPRFFTRGIEYLFFDCVAPIQDDDNPIVMFLKGLSRQVIGKGFGKADRGLQGVGSNTLGDSTTRALTPGAYELEHPDNEGEQNAHRLYDGVKSAALLGGGIAVGLYDGSDRDRPFDSGSTPRKGGGQVTGDGAN